MSTVSYAADLLMDIYQPPIYDTRSSRPVALMAHGGGFTEGGRAGGLQVLWARTLAQHGFVVASFDYTLTTYAKRNSATYLAQIVSEARSALQYIRTSAAALRVDPQRIAAVGDSAGGRLVAMLASRAADQTEQVAASVCMSAWLDKYEDAPQAAMPPLLDFHCRSDTLADYSKAQAAMEGMSEAGAWTAMVTLSDTDCASKAYGGHDPWQLVFTAEQEANMFGFLERSLKLAESQCPSSSDSVAMVA